MHHSFTNRKFDEHHGRLIAIAPYCVLLFVITLVSVIPWRQVLAQPKPGKSPLCTRDSAIEMITQQAELSKTFDNTVQRITVLLRAADLLWPYQQKKGRAIFSEAFELALEVEKENDQKGPRSLVLRMQTPDSRYIVIRGVARRDPAWAKELTRQVLKLDTPNAEGSSTRDSFNDQLTAEKLLDSANTMISSDISSAMDLATVSLNYPASSMLTTFLYRLAEGNQQVADQFYLRALAVYGEKPVREFLYLQAYPFALRDSFNSPIYASYVVPGNFRQNQFLQRQFIQILLRRAQNVLETPLDDHDTYRDPSGALLPGKVHLLRGLMRLEPEVKASLSDLSAPLTQAREKILVSLSPDTQKVLLQPGREVSATPEQTFDEQIELAEKSADVVDRDDRIATLVLSAASEKQSMASVIGAIEKISQSYVRLALMEWLYFRRTIRAVKEKQFEEAERLTSQVQGWDQRAFLHTEIARGLLKRSDPRGREVLDEAIAEANKAGMTIFAARTLLTASSLYATIDLNRSVAVLGNAITVINHLEMPDFSSDDQTLVKTVERKGLPGQYALRFPMPGLNPESAFREMAKHDFDTSLSQVNTLTDKLQRALSTLALAELCLQQTPPPAREKPKKNVRP